MILLDAIVTFSGSGASACASAGGSTLSRDSEKSSESGGRPLRVEEAARVEEANRENVSHDGAARASARSTSTTSGPGSAHRRGGDTDANRTD